MESKWKPVTKLPFCYSRGIHLHHLPGATIWDNAFRWTWGAGFLLYMYRIMGWEVFVTNNEYLFQLPPKLRLPWVCFTWGRGMDCMIRSINFLKDKSTLKIQKLIARNKNCEWRIPECFLCHPSLWRKNLWNEHPHLERQLSPKCLCWYYYSSPESMAFESLPFPVL